MPDHPRIRGEHSGWNSGTPAASGSSPHTRGALPSVQAGAADLGIIPAYAGSTACIATCARRHEDHPRIRGEHLPGDRFRDD